MIKHSELGSELRLSHTLAHSRRRRNTASDSLNQIISQIGSAPLRGYELLV